jgi:hypothetical protein
VVSVVVVVVVALVCCCSYCCCCCRRHHRRRRRRRYLFRKQVFHYSWFLYSNPEKYEQQVQQFHNDR